MVNGDELYLDLREFMCFTYFFYGAVPHEMGTEKLLRRVLRKGDVFVDIGANIGYFTILASRLVGAAGKVYAFEPMPAALRLLRLNTASLDNVTIFPLALSDMTGTATFYVRKRGDTSSLNPDQNASPVPVSVSTLNESLADQARIDLIKIDVEGSELEVLRGGRTILERHKLIVYFELLSQYTAPRGIGWETFVQFFEELNYVLAWVDHSSPYSVLVTPNPSTYVIAAPRARAQQLELSN